MSWRMGKSVPPHGTAYDCPPSRRQVGVSRSVRITKLFRVRMTLRLRRLLLLLLILPEQGVPSATRAVHLGPFQFCCGCAHVGAFLIESQTLEFGEGQELERHAPTMPGILPGLCRCFAYLHGVKCSTWRRCRTQD